MLGRTTASYIKHVSKNIDLGVLENAKLFTEANFLPMNTKIIPLN